MKDLACRYRALQRWVERERARLAETRERPTQRYLRRARLVVEVDAVTMRELARELAQTRGRR